MRTYASDLSSRQWTWIFFTSHQCLEALKCKEYLYFKAALFATLCGFVPVRQDCHNILLLCIKVSPLKHHTKKGWTNLVKRTLWITKWLFEVMLKALMDLDWKCCISCTCNCAIKLEASCNQQLYTCRILHVFKSYMWNPYLWNHRRWATIKV